MSFIEENKKTRRTTIEEIAEPRILSVPLRLDGYKGEPIVKEGDCVEKWQLIADGEHTVHAPTSGKIEFVNDQYVVIRNDFSSKCFPVKPVEKTVRELSCEELTQIAHNAGIWCKGHKMPLWKVLQDGNGKFSKIIINLCENQPFVTSMYRLAVENADQMLGGIKILLKACGVRKAVIAIDSDKRALINILRKKCRNTPLLTLKPIKERYPSENPRRLIYIIDSKETPAKANLADLGYGVFDVKTCIDMYNALIKGVPCVTCTVTVEGDCIKTPKNLTVPVGTSVSHIAQYCGGIIKPLHKIVSGGPLDGVALWDEDQPVNKDSCAVLMLSEDYSKKKETPCIRCARCSKICPMYLMPMKIMDFYEKGNTAKCFSYGVTSCISCGLCSYVCPANIPLTRKMSEVSANPGGEQNG